MSRKQKRRGRPRKLNQYKEIPGSYIGQLLHGKNFAIDAADLELIREYTWRSNSKNYVFTTVMKDGRRKRIFLHRLILGVQDIDWKEVQVDHKDGDPLNNRRANLRLAMAAENQINKKAPRRDSTTGATGVVERNGKWIAFIGFHGRKEHLGVFDTKDEAIEIRKEAEELLYGEFSPKGKTEENH